MPSHTRSLTTTLALVVFVVLAGCSGGGADGGNAGGAGGGENVGASAAAGGGADNAGGGPAVGSAQTGNIQALQAQRAIVKTGRVQVEVENFSAASRTLTLATRRAGGYVSASSETTTGEDANRTTGRLVLRVPNRNFSALYNRARNTGTLIDANENQTDVTSSLVDLRARLSNLRSQRERLRGLYANASDTEDVLKVQKRLSTTQSRIERLEAQLKSLEGRVALSTITVELTEPAPERVRESWYDVGVVGAFLASVDGVLTTLRATVVALAYLAPYLLAFGLPAVAVGYAAYRRRE